jgi:hypothetical protein
VVRQRREGIEGGAHVELATGAIEEREIDRHAARMRRAAARVGEEFRIGPGVPQCPLRLDRPQGVEDPQAEAERPGKRDRRRELVGRLAMQPAFGVPVDRPAR